MLHITNGHALTSNSQGTLVVSNKFLDIVQIPVFQVRKPFVDGCAFGFSFILFQGWPSTCYITHSTLSKLPLCFPSTLLTGLRLHTSPNVSFPELESPRHRVAVCDELAVRAVTLDRIDIVQKVAIIMTSSKFNG